MLSLFLKKTFRYLLNSNNYSVLPCKHVFLRFVATLNYRFPPFFQDEKRDSFHINTGFAADRGLWQEQGKWKMKNAFFNDKKVEKSGSILVEIVASTHLKLSARIYNYEFKCLKVKKCPAFILPLMGRVEPS